MFSDLSNADRAVAAALLAEVHVSSGALVAVAALHRRTKRPFVEVILREGLLPESRLTEILAKASGKAILDLEGVEPSAGALELLPPKLARRLQLLPLDVADGVLYVASSNSLNQEGVMQLEDHLDSRGNLCEVEVYQARPSQLRWQIARSYPQLGMGAVAPPQREEDFGEMLLRRGKVSAEELQEARLAASDGGDLVIELNAIVERDREQRDLALHHGLHFVSHPEQLYADPEALSALQRDDALRLLALPFARVERGLVLAIADLTQQEAIREWIPDERGELFFCLAPKAKLQNAIRHFYSKRHLGAQNSPYEIREEYKGMRMGEILVSLGYVSAREIEAAEPLFGRGTGNPIGEVFVRRGAIDHEQLAEALALQAGCAYVPFGKAEVSDERLHDSMHEGYWRVKQLFPLQRLGSSVLVATANPQSPEMVQELPQLLQTATVVPVVMSPLAIASLHSLHLGDVNVPDWNLSAVLEEVQHAVVKMVASEDESLPPQELVFPHKTAKGERVRTLVVTVRWR